MKHLKIICAICIAAQLGTISITSQASEILSESTEDTRINALLEQYFSERENDFVNPKLSTIQIIAGQSNDYELSNSEMRSCLISKMEERLDLTIVSSDTTYSISEMTMENNLVHLKVYEWTSVEYSEDSGLIDMFGYGVDHSIVLENLDNTYSMISDTYDEGPLTGMTSSLSKVEFINLINSDYSVYDETPNNTQLKTENSTGKSVSGYNPYKAAEYANRWVYSSADGSANYTAYYNTAQYATNGTADCTNYVSQCLYAGGVKMDSTSNVNGWWYNSNNSTPWSYVWFTANPHFEHFKTTNTSLTNVTNDSYIIPGNPVYYDWQNSLDSDDDFDHAAICVGYDLYGVPIVNSHSYDYYHVRWNYGYTTTKHGTVKITNDDVLNNKSGAAVIRVNSPYYAKINTSSDVDYFKFTVPGVYGQSRYYTIKTSGSTDTYGIVYSSSDSLLAYDDNSGNDSNFEITTVLTSGFTYYIAVSSQNGSSGFYGLTIM